MNIKIYRNFSEILTNKITYDKDGRNLSSDDCSIILNGTIVFNNDKIIWAGEDSDLPAQYQSMEFLDFSGHVLTPEIVDCHTHLVFGGDRAFEYKMRLNGADYEEIGKAGGGILNTQKGTNSRSKESLFKQAVERIERIHSYGVGTIEIKSGYGLNHDKEKEITLLIHELKKYFKGKVQILNTFMAAHAIPAGFSTSKEYLICIVIPLIEELAPLKIIDAIDIFHEKGYFTTEDTELIFQEAKNNHINFKSHADEFGDNKGALLAAKKGALSTDHLLCTTDDGIEALANSSTVATLLPGTGFFLGKPQANARAFLDAGVKVAIGSDFNPGSCHWDNVLQVASMAAPTYKMNFSELWASITLNAAHALGLKHQGALLEGLKPRFSIFKIESISHLTYHWGRNFSTNQKAVTESD